MTACRRRSRRSSPPIATAWWKLKVGGNVAADVDQLCRIASVLDRLHGYHVSLDGNEQYEDAAGVLALWHAMQAEPRLARLNASIAFIEQPVKRARALEGAMGALAAARPVIVDESDGPLDAFVQAKALGYTGISSKACKGVWRSLINLARCRAWNATEAEPRYFMSAEDLTTLAGVCVQQDLALVSAMGLVHVERNGHHFVDGFAGRPKAEAVRFMEAYPGALCRHAARAAAGHSRGHARPRPGGRCQGPRRGHRTRYRRDGPDAEGCLAAGLIAASGLHPPT